jgi:hypothetical protein
MRLTGALAVTLAALAAALVSASSAPAKGAPPVILVCGPGGCLGTADADVLAEFVPAAWGEDAPQPARPAPLGPYYELRGDRHYPMTYGYYVPGASSFSVFAESRVVWRGLGPDTRREFERLAARLKPYPTPMPYSFVRNNKALEPVASFLPLLGPLPAALAPPARTTLVLLAFWWEQPNPWSGAFALRYDPPTGRLFRDGTWLRVPAALARRLR